MELLRGDFPHYVDKNQKPTDIGKYVGVSHADKGESMGHTESRIPSPSPQLLGPQ